MEPVETPHRPDRHVVVTLLDGSQPDGLLHVHIHHLVVAGLAFHASQVDELVDDE